VTTDIWIELIDGSILDWTY